MANKSKFKQGQKVKSVLNKYTNYEVVEVLKNDLRVRVTDEGFTDIEFTCKKSLFEVLKNV